MFITNSTLRILCFGDSLTQGWSLSTNPIVHPYAGNLETTLKTGFPSVNISTDVQGVGGDQTECPPGRCPGFLPRMQKLYQNLEDHKSNDWAVILGGTNDVVWSREAADIYSSLQKVWDIPLSHGTKVLALTVPECADCGEAFDNRTRDLNAMIMNHSADNFYTFNLHDSVPYWGMPEKMRKIMWDDSIHWTPKGYDLVGGRIAERLQEILKDLDSSGDLTEDLMRGELK